MGLIIRVKKSHTIYYRMSFFQIKKYLNYCLHAKYRKGYGLHSPFVFNLVREVFYCEHSFYAFDLIKEYKNELKLANKVISVVDYGAGSSNFTSKDRSVEKLVKASSISTKYGELLFRLLQHINPHNILELGTSIGISTLYLALADRRREVLTIEGCVETAKQAQIAFDKFDCSNVKQFVGQFQDVLPNLVAKTDVLDFVFFDGNHQKQATIDYFNLCLTKVGANSVFVFDDIYWSKGMSEAWDIIRQHPQVTVSIDVFQLGIVFFNKDYSKQNFVVRL
ncbi:class I SAM-dependent methyltransferase [Carboxylicivirga sp. M1479]|nr:class I SAM-dependent methyltransferase [Carboxylicivirga sp. M1479]